MPNGYFPFITKSNNYFHLHLHKISVSFSFINSPSSPLRFIKTIPKMNNLMTKSFLSYQDLKKEALKDLEANTDPSPALTSSMELASKCLHPFLEEADSIQSEMSSIRSLLSDLQNSISSSKSLSNPDSIKKTRSQMNSTILQVLKKARQIRDRLESMDHANAENRLLPNFHAGSPIDRTRTSVTNGLRKKLKELMFEFQDLRSKMMADYKETVERRYFTVTGKVPDEEVIERIMADGKSEDMVREVQERYDAVKEVERSLLELHQVFLDMAVMVEVQGDKMDDIEQNVSNAGHYVRSGAKELGVAKGYQRSGRKWLCIGAVVLLVFVLLLLIPILSSLRRRS